MYLVTKGFQNKLRAKHITKRSSGTHAAWHFWFAVSFWVKAVCGNLVYTAFAP
nr:DUF3265 domain-containing protein [Vibrio sp. Vb2880]